MTEVELKTLDVEAADIWSDDYLDRKSDARFLIDFLTARIKSKKDAGQSASFVLNLDAKWGEGKTHFLTHFQQQLQSEEYLAVYVNAWSIDHIGDPLIPVLSGLQAAFKPFLKGKKSSDTLKKLKTNAATIVVNLSKGILQTAVKRYVGAELSELAEGIDAAEGDVVEVIGQSAIDSASNELSSLSNKMTDKLIESFEKEKDAIVSFQHNLSAIIEAIGKSGEKKSPVFLLIDELDRCKPSFAVALLERVKHLFSTDNLVTIVATDTSQLKHSINGVYGGEFDGYSYLKRFFDRSYVFAKSDTSRFVDMCMARLDLKKARCPNQKFHDLFLSGIDHFGLSLRDFEQCIELIENVLVNWNYSSPVDMVLLYPCAIEFHKKALIDLNELPKRCKNWTMIEVGTSYNPTTMKSTKTRFNVSNLISHMISHVPTLVNASKMASDDAEEEYARDTFAVEWTGKPTQLNNRPSIQSTIPDMLSSVSRFKV